VHVVLLMFSPDCGRLYARNTHGSCSTCKMHRSHRHHGNPITRRADVLKQLKGNLIRTLAHSALFLTIALLTAALAVFIGP
jgi:hypothetical protein